MSVADYLELKICILMEKSNKITQKPGLVNLPSSPNSLAVYFLSKFSLNNLTRTEKKILVC